MFDKEEIKGDSPHIESRRLTSIGFVWRRQIKNLVALA
jgi:hypothetical protein